MWHVLGEALYIPIQEMQKPGFLLFMKELVEGSEGEGTLPESHSWRAQRQAPGTVGPSGLQTQSLSTSWPGFFTTFGIMDVRDLSGFAFRIARCYLRD